MVGQWTENEAKEKIVLTLTIVLKPPVLGLIIENILGCTNELKPQKLCVKKMDKVHGVGALVKALVQDNII